MFTNASCTISHKQRNGRQAEFVQVLISPVYWEGKIGQHLNSNQNRVQDVSQTNEITVIIPESSLGDILPEKDDKITRCDENGNCIGASFTILHIEDFRYGSPHVRHIEVTAK